MPRKKSVRSSKTAETCQCGCCKWHSSKVIEAVLAAMFILIVVSFAASIIFSSNAYFSRSVLSFMGVVFLIVFIGWVFAFFCSCKGTHLSRHGYTLLDDSRIILRKRYAKGEITKREYDAAMADLE